MSRLWRSRAYLPHWELSGAVQFITWRTADSLPAEWLRALDEELSHLAPEERTRVRMRRVDRMLDLGHGECWLRDPVTAGIVKDAIRHWDGSRYDLTAFCIMPNHVHILIRIHEPWNLSGILHSLKSYTSHRIVKELGRTEPVWQREYFDRAMRDEEHTEKTRKYIEWNPVKAGLCPDPKDWPFSSAWRF